ncbi:MAG: Gfo/Idh/MocA family protein [Motilibacteraceae bacterium]
MTCWVGVVGTGWRAEFFLRLAALLPEVEVVGVVARRAEKRERAAARWGIAAVESPAELVRRHRPHLVVTCVSREANPAVVTELVGLGVAVLSETPPAAAEEDLHRLWDAVGASGRVHVAEQYLLMPGHAARLELVRRGLLGEVGQVQVSSTHDYHAVSMARGLLGVGLEPAEVTARAVVAPLVQPLTRQGWTDDDNAQPAATTLAVIEWKGRSALYDFTDNQWHNPLRTRRIVVRGSRGELDGDDVIRLAGPRTVLRSSIVRRQLGHDLDLDGYDTDHLSFEGEVLWRNPFLDLSGSPASPLAPSWGHGPRLSDEELAIATSLRQAARWAVGEAEGPYPLADACQDHLVALAVHEAVATGRTVRTRPVPWARS